MPRLGWGLAEGARKKTSGRGRSLDEQIDAAMRGTSKKPAAPKKASSNGGRKKRNGY